MRQYGWLVVSAAVVSVLFAAPARADEGLMEKLRPALIVIDIQNEYLPHMAGEERDLALRVINGAIMLFRERNLPVVRVYHTDPQRGPKPGSEGFQFPPSILVRADDPMVVKNFPSAFKHTELDSMLHEMGCDSVFLCGLSAVGCVLATYYGAKDLDYNVFMIKDAIMSHNTSYTTVVEEAFDTISYGALKFLLEYARY